jgi:hypothetical protein
MSRVRRFLESLEMTVGSLRVSVNPRNIKDLQRDLQLEPHGNSYPEVRILWHEPTDTIYIWDAWYGTHEDVAQALGLDIEACVKHHVNDALNASWSNYDRSDFEKEFGAGSIE